MQPFMTAAGAASIGPMAKRNASDWTDKAFEALRGAGYRSGGSRSQVVELLGSEDCALTALEIDRRLPTVGRASVYRTLEQLEQIGLAQRVDLGGEAAGFERVDPGGNHHHHMVCVNCGRVVPFEDPSLERAIGGVSRRVSFDVSEHDVTLRGTCSRCG
jgi:Fur family ferric uptake transcriptional regulator